MFSTTLLQRRTEDSFLGRVSGTDNLIITLTMGVSTILAGFAMEKGLFQLREMLLLTAFIQISMGILWLTLASPREKAFMKS